MSVSQSGVFSVQEFADAGLPLALGRLYTFAFGTTTQKTAYTDAAGAVPHTYTSDGAGGSYIALNSRGELPAPLYLLTDGPYDLALKRADGSSVWTRRADAAAGASGTTTAIAAAVASFAATGGSGMVGFLQAGSGAVARTAQSKMGEVVSVKDFGAVGDGVTNDTTAIQAALNSVATGKSVTATIYFPAGTYLINAGLTALGRNVILRGDGPRSSMLSVAAGVTAVALNATGCNAACIGMMNMGIVESGAQPAMVGITVRNTGDFVLQNVYVTTSGKAIDIGSSATDVTFSLLSQVRVECFGAQEAIRMRSGGGNWSNVYCRKFRTAGVVGPALWVSGQVTSLGVSNCSFGGKGTARSIQITQITDGGTSFTITAASNGFIAGEYVVIRGTGTSYDATWKIATTPDANTLTVTSSAGLGSLTPGAAFVDKLHATVYLDNTSGAVNEVMWTNVLFEGIDDGGSAGGVGSVSLYVDASGGSAAILGHQFNGCLFDCGQTAVHMTGKNAGGGDYLVSDFRFNGGVIRYVKNGFYLREVRGIFISDFAGDCIRSHGSAAELSGSAGVYLDSLGFQAIEGITIAHSTIGRQASFNVASISAFSPDYGLRIGGSPQDLRWTGCHFFGIQAAVHFDSGSVLDVSTRLVDTDCTYASGLGGETNATRIPTVSSATSITLPFGDEFGISGTTTMTTMLGGWVGRKVLIYTASAVTFNTGGNIANAVTTVAGQLVQGVFDGANWHIR